MERYKAFQHGGSKPWAYQVQRVDALLEEFGVTFTVRKTKTIVYAQKRLSNLATVKSSDSFKKKPIRPKLKFASIAEGDSERQTPQLGGPMKRQKTDESVVTDKESVNLLQELQKGGQTSKS